MRRFYAICFKALNITFVCRWLLINAHVSISHVLCMRILSIWFKLYIVESSLLFLFAFVSSDFEVSMRYNPFFLTQGLDHVITAIRSLIPVSRGVICAELLQMRQSHEEPIRTFAARVCGFLRSGLSARCPELDRRFQGSLSMTLVSRPQQTENELRAIEAYPDADLHVSQVFALSSLSDHPKARLHLSIADRDQHRHVPVEAIADTGA